MTDIGVRRFVPEDAPAWDELVSRAPMGTFLHSRRFLAYHGDRLHDVSLVLTSDRDAVVAVLPAALSPDDPATVVSHPGATFGGIVHDGALAGDAMVQALSAAIGAFADDGRRILVYRPVPHIYHRMPSADDLYALFRLGAERVRCDVSTSVDLANRGPLSSRRRRALRQAQRAGVEVRRGNELLGDLWPILEENLASRHDVRPVHTLEEMRVLAELLPESIEAWLAFADGHAVAGTVIFLHSQTWHAQYIAASDEGRSRHALDAIFDSAIAASADAGARYFDFGVSNEPGSNALNHGLLDFKRGFGGGSIVHETFELECRAS